MKIYSLFLVFLVAISRIGMSQEIGDELTLDEAIEIALEYNFDIRIAKNNSEISANNATRGNAGFAPDVSLAGNYNYTLSDSRSEFASPQQEPIDVSGAESVTWGGGINLSYNIYSGNQRVATYRKLQNAYLQGNLRERQTIETVISNVINLYLNAASQLQAYDITRESIDISLDRYNRAQERYNYGTISKLQLLNAEVDLSTDSTSLVQSKLSYEKSITNLNNALGISPDADYAVVDNFQYASDLVISNMIDQAMSNNADYLLAKASLDATQYDLEISRSSLFPRLDLGGGYSYSRTTNDASFLTLTESLGLNAGLTLSYTLFNGGNRNRQIQNAKIAMESQQTTLEKSENTIKTNILNSYEDYLTNLKLIDLTDRNLKLAEANYERSQEAFATGQITGIELREAQINLANAKYNLSLQKIQTKMAEVNLYRFTGKLVE